MDDLAGLLIDIRALAEMAADTEREESRLREAEVNDQFGGFISAILGDQAPTGPCLEVEGGTKRIDYRIIDESGCDLLPIMNQASLNATALALLFAQAARRVRSGLPTWVVLDDPVQSLDSAHQRGLADAIDKLSHACQVIVAAPPQGEPDFTDRVERFVTSPRRIAEIPTGLGTPDAAASFRTRDLP